MTPSSGRRRRRTVTSFCFFQLPNRLISSRCFRQTQNAHRDRSDRARNRLLVDQNEPRGGVKSFAAIGGAARTHAFAEWCGAQRRQNWSRARCSPVCKLHSVRLRLLTHLLALADCIAQKFQPLTAAVALLAEVLCWCALARNQL